SDSQGILIANPVFSPDGSTIAFIDILGPTESTIKKLPITGGTATALTDLHWELGMQWDRDRIIFSHSAGGLGQIGSVPSSGGKAEILIDMKDELAYDPEVLPDGQTVLFTLGKISSDWKDQIVVQSLKTGKRKTLLQGETARYISPGRLVF